MDPFQSAFSIYFREAFDRVTEPGLLPGRVVRVESDRVHVLTESAQLLLPVRKRFVHETGLSPVTGDWVAVDAARSAVRHVLPRRTEFTRQAAGRRTASQVLAANIDVVFILTGLDAD